ncbi:FkbM family methyltransferase [Trichothermofontia sichuanensis B231]|uniref:FkbM family methyltransferase n=1 Tax=Trichothermofontia sichuanensis TaxID=3045816 RepID=UPI002245D910|nr:FkbM family methyltransferase [Trichothermofontia sichuanensis]UZQ53051.1 FkbM family methyltransferase [Trichothermofontia sichuanensis B231]
MATFLVTLKQLGHLEQMGFTVVNVGSRKISAEDDYAQQDWSLFAPNLKIYGFDADEEACAQANADLARRNINWLEKHVPIALSNTVGRKTLYITKNPMCSSLYAPNEPFLARLSGLPELVNLDYTLEVETTTLEAFCQAEGIETIDFLQVDVQGADLQVLQGANSLLQNILAIQIEVEFSPLYINQPLFADVDAYLRSQGFSLFDLLMARRLRARSPVANTRHPGQVLWGDAFYFRDLLQAENRDQQSPERLFRLACIADVMQFPDYALEILEYITLNYGRDNPRYNFANVIVQVLAQAAKPTGRSLESLPIVASLRDFITRSELLKPN